MVLVMASFAMPAPPARKVFLVMNVSAHVGTAGEGMELIVPVSCDKLAIRATREQEKTVTNNIIFRSYVMKYALRIPIVWCILN